MRSSFDVTRAARFAGIVILSVTAASSPAAQTPPAVDSTKTSRNSHVEPIRSVRAVRREGSISIDGKLNEAGWSKAQPATDFLQVEPKSGELATQRTEVRFLFDGEALYVGARMFDSLGKAGVKPMLVRRDQYNNEADWITLVFDTFHDHLGRTRFSVNASGAKEDAYGPGGSNPDPSWDPIWEQATSIDDLGWVAEMRIPLSQLRFPQDSLQTWGVNIIRFVSRLNESSYYSWWKNNEIGGPARFNHIEGLELAKSSSGRLEVLPYVVTRNAYVKPSDPLNPFEHKVFYDVRFGGDVKYLLTSNLTLNATVNPDFGQVEADPAVINLSQFETSFPEKRPFFIEGQGFFGFGNFSCFFCSNVSSMNLFYSRRIGRLPQASGLAFTKANGGFVDLPENTTILGAAKITGRTKNGYSIGFLDALTGEGRADVRTDAGVKTEQIVEPRTNYLVGRLKRDFRSGNTVLGGIVTSTRRNMNDPGLVPLLPQHAEAVGSDFNINFKNRMYSLFGQYAFSTVGGDSLAITRLQKAPAHYFQRPDRRSKDGFLSDALDPRANAMHGAGGYTRFAKDGGDWLYETSFNFRTPGFEVNDLAFNSRSDYFWHNVNFAKSVTKPNKYQRNMFSIIGGQRQQNFDGDFTDGQLHVYHGMTFPNYWYANTFVMYRPEASDDRLLRGGPVVRRAQNAYYSAYVSSDSRNKLVLETSPYYQKNAEGFDNYGLNLFARFKPASNVSVNFGPSYSYGSSGAQYVTSYADAAATDFYGRRYVMSSIVQKTVSFDTRVQWTFTPTLTLEVFMQPLVGSVDYYDFKEFEAPRRLAKRLYGTQGSTIDSSVTASGRVTQYTVDADGGTATNANTFDNPDFIFRSLIGNAVLRWEYMPGSTMFLVWQQNRNGSDGRGDFDFGRDYTELFRTNPQNYFLVKVNYWLGR